MECRKKLYVTDGLVGSLVHDKDLTGIPPLARAGQEQEQAQSGTAGEGCGHQVLPNSFERENAVLDEAGRDVVAYDDGANPWRHGCNRHPGAPRLGDQAPSRHLNASVTEPKGSSKLAHTRKARASLCHLEGIELFLTMRFRRVGPAGVQVFALRAGIVAQDF